MKYQISFLVFVIVVCSTTIFSEPIRQGFIDKETAIVYSGPTTDSTAIDTLKFGEFTLVYGIKTDEQDIFNQEGWSKVRTPDGKLGWIDYSILLISNDVTYVAKPGDIIYEQPDALSTVVDSIKTINPLSAFELEEIDEQYWLKLYSYSGTKWLQIDSLSFQIEFKYYELVNNFLGYGYQFFNFSPYKDYNKALKIAQVFSETIDPETSFISDGIYEDMGKVKLGSGAFAYYLKFIIYQRFDEWENAITALENIANIYPNQSLIKGNAGAWADLEIGKIYHYKLEEYNKAIFQYHRTIQKHPFQELHGYESTDYVDIRAAFNIFNMIKSSTHDTLESNGSIIVNTAENPAAKLLGFCCQAASLGKQKKYTELLDLVESAITEYPECRRLYYLSSRDYSTTLVSLAFEILKNNQQYDKYYQFSNRMSEKFKNYPVGELSAFKKAYLADISNEDIPTIISYYKTVDKISRDNGNYEYFNSITNEVYYSNLSSNRLATLSETKPVKATTIQDSVQLKLGIDGEYTILALLPQNVSLTKLYTDQFLIHTDFEGLYTKVLLEDSTIGWVLSEQIESIIENTMPSINDSLIHSMNRALSENNPVFDGDEIRNPQIENILENFSARFLRFCDFNNDNITDFITFKKGNYLTLNAINGKSFVIEWTFYVNSSITSQNILNEKLFIKTRYNVLQCIDISNGELKWEKGENQYQRQLIAPLIINNKLYNISQDSFLVCLDPQNGQELWKGDCKQKNVDSFHGNDSALVISYKDSLKVFNIHNGEFEWGISGRIYNKPTINKNKLYYFNWENGVELIKCDLVTGNIEWKFDAIRSFSSSEEMLVTSNNVIFNTGNSIYAVSKNDGELEWQKNINVSSVEKCAAGNTLYVLSNRFSDYSGLAAYDLASGIQQWQMDHTLESIYFHSNRIFVEGLTGLLIINNANSTLTEEPSHITEFALDQNYPNPFNMNTTIQYRVHKNANVNITIYNMLGQKIITLISKAHSPGMYQTTWDGLNNKNQMVSSGLYFYQINIDGEIKTKSMILVK